MFVIQRAIPPAPPKVSITLKLRFPDGDDVVVAAPCRELWRGADGTAFDRKPDAHWTIVARNRPSGIVVL